MPMRIRTLTPADVTAVLAIQAEAPEIAQWSRSDYAHAIENENRGWIAGDGESAAGFLVARRAADEIEILNLAVCAAWRRQGLGTRLLDAALEWGITNGAIRAILDVRPSNFAALRLYHRHGFRIEGRRQRYYNLPLEDALLLGCSLRGDQPLQPENGGSDDLDRLHGAMRYKRER